jgi:hypothetical protein
MVAAFFESIEDHQPESRGGGQGERPGERPGERCGGGGEITRRLRGSIRPANGRSADEQDYRRYLEQKHEPR